MTERPLSREDLLAGLSGRRVSTALYAVQTRTAELAGRARHATAPAICEGAVAQRERAFLSALAAGRDRAGVAVTAPQLERYAPQWAHLAPTDPDSRAELARRLGDTHRFRASDVPRIRAVLDLDGAQVRAAHARRHGRDLDTIYTPVLTRRERLGWWRSRTSRRLAELPPFWVAFGLTLTETVGAGTLALPIALAGIGPLPGVVLIAVLGLVNVLTVAALAETFTRSGAVRWGGAYLARLVRELLGPAATAVLTAALFVFCLVALLAYYVGFSATLAAVSGIGATWWAAVLFVAVLALLRRGGLGATVASALVVGAVNIGAVLVLSVLAFGHLDTAYLTHARLPFADGGPLDPAVLGLVFGVVLFAFFGHTSVANCAQVVLHREPSGRSLVAGAALATVTAIAVYALWVLAVGGAIAPQRLAAEPGTALVPLAEVLGAPALVLGAVFAVLAMGMAAVHFSWGLVNQVREWTDRRLGLVPVAGVFVLVEVLLVTGRESFTAQVGVLGTATLPLLAGVFPMLLLVAARRRGECVPGWRPGWLGSAVVVGALYVLFLGALAVHGLLIWEHPAQRVLALAVVAVVAAVTVAVVRGGRLVPRVTAGLRTDAETGRVHLELTAAGEPLTGAAPEVDCAPPTGVVTVQIPPGPAVREVFVRLHRTDPDGRSRPQPGLVELDARPLPVADGIASGRIGPGMHELRLIPGGRIG
ncbi:aromatic amino acid transport family protein [Pseudonocardia sp.]|uniref:aromatic amino acid transport family protein n=1 Tax=Pseudonocardia sp. TaxID=60912 RepID=UPI00260A9446|nr:aromatic amino acid transport family protein [Pseudonocardia sp.]